MFLVEPPRSDYDLNFNFFGFHVRAHPFFFLVSLLFGRHLVYAPDINTGVAVTMGVVVFFVSILFHELGHSLAQRRYGMGSRIVLYAMGGMAIPETRGRNIRLSHLQSIFISFAGPLAGFLVGVAFIILGMLVMGRAPESLAMGFIPVFYPGTPEFMRNELLMATINGFIIIGFFLNLLNLLPIYPLDGGQIARSVFEIFDKWDGVRKSLMLSIATAIVCGVYSLQRQNTFAMLFCFYLAYQSYQQLNPAAGRRW